MWCSNERVKAPQTTYERAFHDKGAASPASIRWLGRTSYVLGKHIHHPLCGHGGERWIAGAPVDGYDTKTQTVYHYQGSYWHGCVHCFLDTRQKIVNNGKTRDEAFFATAERTRPLREAGYRVIKKWECQDKKTRDPHQNKKQDVPHPILYDFESYHDKTQPNEATRDLIYENAQMPISVSLGDTLDREPPGICDPNPKELTLRRAVRRHNSQSADRKKKRTRRCL